jgi:hypothetical protein
MMSTIIGDDELLARFVAGDAEAFVAFYRRHRAAVLGFFLRPISRRWPDPDQQRLVRERHGTLRPAGPPLIS